MNNNISTVPGDVKQNEKGAASSIGRQAVAVVFGRVIPPLLREELRSRRPGMLTDRRVWRSASGYVGNDEYLVAVFEFHVGFGR